MTSSVTLERRGAVALLTIDNGPLNLLNAGLRARLRELAEQLGADPDVRAVVLQGGLRAFSVGSDITEFPPDAETGLALARGEHACCEAIASLPQPVIAALEGHVLGGGLELAVACDLRVAGRDAVLGMPEVALGVFPGECAVTLPRLLGPTHAKRLMLLGESVDAGEALRLGLVDAVAAAGAAAGTALAWAERIAGHPALAVRAIKAAVDEGVRGPEADARRARDERTMAEMFESHDAQEGVSAFLAKRPPRFRHH